MPSHQFHEPGMLTALGRSLAPSGLVTGGGLWWDPGQVSVLSELQIPNL